MSWAISMYRRYLMFAKFVTSGTASVARSGKVFQTPAMTVIGTVTGVLGDHIMMADFLKTWRRPMLRLMSLAISVGVAGSSLPKAGHAIGTAEQQAACGGDVIRFCLSAYPNMELLKICMTKNKNNLSSKCRAVLQKG